MILRGMKKKGAIAAVFITGLLGLAAAPVASADFSITSFDAFLAEQDGSASFEAGAHPFSYTTEFSLSSTTDSAGNVMPDENPHGIEVRVPAGLVGNPTAVPLCTEVQLMESAGNPPIPKCSLESQIGVAEIDFTLGGAQPTTALLPLYNVSPSPGTPARFAANLFGIPLFFHPKVRTGEDYGVSVEMLPVSQATPFIAARITLWGVPADPAHDPERGQFCLGGQCAGGGTPSGAAPKAFLTNPSNCSAGPLTTTLRVDSWQNIGVFEEATTVSHLLDGTPTGIVGCSRLPFDPSVSVEPETTAANSPMGLHVRLQIPQNEDPDDRASAYLKRARVTLPAGVTLNPSAGAGLTGCTTAQADLGSPRSLDCPNSSKIGSVRIDTPLVDHPLEGGVYAAAQGDNPFHSLLAIYIGVEDAESGVVLKLAGKVEADPASGQLTTVVDDSPQLPFSSFDLEFFSGPRAALKSPSQCGAYQATAAFSSWAAADPNNPTAAETVTSVSDFKIDQGPNGGPCPTGRFEPKLSAGTVNPLAGSYSPMLLRVSRPDASQELKSLEVDLPRGLLAKLAGIPYCSEAQIAAASARGGEGAGAIELALPSCPAASQVGSVTVAAGAGPSPLFIDGGKAYLGGPYKGAPLSLVVITPAIAGPFDLGAVVVRSTLRVDPVTLDVRAVTDPLPSILHGIPLALRDVRVNLDRERFVLNPTNCDPKAFAGTALALSGATSPLSEHFQVGDCERLRFKPRLSLRLRGGTKRGQYPSLRAVLRAKEGEANIGRVSVTLPHSGFLAQEHIDTVCTRVQFAADNCPQGSVYGYAVAKTPLLGEPLQGPVYLRSSNNPLPDLVAALGGQFDVDLVGRIDSVRGRLRTTFAQVPDAPVTQFVLTMRGGKKGLVVNSRGICRSVNRARVSFAGQNGKGFTTNPKVKPSCKGKSKHRKKGR